jgi:hypothetical protein
MTKHKTEDYKISAVKYYLNNDRGDGYKKTCKIRVLEEFPKPKFTRSAKGKPC